MTHVPPKVRVLIAEDNADTMELLCLYLTQQNFVSVPTNNGVDAVRLAREQRFDAYLIDNRLPGVSGVELCRRIRQFDSDTPIVFYSGDAHQSAKDEAFLAGAQGYVVKPSNCQEVLEALLAALRTVRSARPTFKNESRF